MARSASLPLAPVVARGDRFARRAADAPGEPLRAAGVSVRDASEALSGFVLDVPSHQEVATGDCCIGCSASAGSSRGGAIS
jgi:hypothetical protein